MFKGEGNEPPNERELGIYIPKALYKIMFYTSCQESSHLIFSVEVFNLENLHST